MEQVEDEGVGGQLIMAGVGADRHDVMTCLRFALVNSQVLLGDTMQFREQLDAHDAAERIVCGHQQGSTFARPQVDEYELAEVNVQAVQHLAEHFRFRGLISGMQNPEQAVAPTHGATRSVDTVVPIVIYVTVALAAAGGSGIPQEPPKVADEHGEHGERTVAGAAIPPPTAKGAGYAGVERNSGMHNRMVMDVWSD